MNAISIITAQNIELEFELGSLGDRIVGRILDLAVLICYTFILIIMIGFRNIIFFIENRELAASLLLGFPWLFYDLLSELLLNGQSLGKKVMGIKVMSLNGAQAGLSQYLIRWLFRAIDFFFFGIVALISVAATAKKQRLGDLIAGTVLVKTSPGVQISDTIFQATPEGDYEVSYPEVINLRDQDIQLIKEILKNVYQSGNNALAFQAQQKVEKVLNIRSTHNDSKDFLKAILVDYNYLTSRL